MPEPIPVNEVQSKDWRSSLPWWGSLTVWAVERVGIPTVLLCVVGWFIMTKVAEPVVASHIEFMNSQIASTTALIKNNDALKAAMEDDNRSMKKLAAGQDEAVAVLKTLCTEQKKTTTAVREIPALGP